MTLYYFQLLLALIWTSAQISLLFVAPDSHIFQILSITRNVGLSLFLAISLAVIILKLRTIGWHSRFRLYIAIFIILNALLFVVLFSRWSHAKSTLNSFILAEIKYEDFLRRSTLSKTDINTLDKLIKQRIELNRQQTALKQSLNLTKAEIESFSVFHILGLLFAFIISLLVPKQWLTHKWLMKQFIFP